MVNKKNLLHLTSRFIEFFFLVAIIISTSVLVNIFGPSTTLYSDDDWEDAEKVDIPGYNDTLYKGVMDQHSHTYYSDGDLSVIQNIEWHIAMGFNVIVISDHNTLANKDDVEEAREKYKDDDIIIIQGMEWTTNRIHMNIIGLTEWDLPIPDNPSDDDIQETIDEAHEQDAIVTCNHILWSINEAEMDEHPSRDDVLKWGIDYIEVINGDTLSENSYDEESVEFCKDEGLGQITGTDMHRPGSVNAWTLLNISKFSEDEVMEELRNYRTKIHISNMSFEDLGIHRDNPWYILIEPLDKFGGNFRDLWLGDGLDWIGVLIWVMFFVIIFAIVEGFQFVKPKFWKRINERKNKPTPTADAKVEVKS